MLVSEARLIVSVRYLFSGIFQGNVSHLTLPCLVLVPSFKFRALFPLSLSHDSKRQQPHVWSPK